MITGINIVRNCIETGYPFIESILSAYPLCTEYLVNDGGSTDGTLEALQELQEVYTGIRIFRFPDTKSVRWDCVSDQINRMIRISDGNIIFLGNADELIHEKDLPVLKKILRDNPIPRVLRFNRREIKHNWSGLSEDVYHPARIAEKKLGIRQDWNAYGGDEFLYDDGWPDPDRENKLNMILYHLYNMFPGNRVAKLRNDAEHLSPGDKIRVHHYRRMKDTKPNYRRAKKIYWNLPALAKGLPYMRKYKIRECLYNKEWVERVTGLSYS